MYRLHNPQFHILSVWLVRKVILLSNSCYTGVCIIGASLSEPHINGTAVSEICVWWWYIHHLHVALQTMHLIHMAEAT